MKDLLNLLKTQDHIGDFDGIRIGLYANISRPDEAHLVSEYRLDGVGRRAPGVRR